MSSPLFRSERFCNVCAFLALLCKQCKQISPILPQARTSAYQQALEGNPNLVQDSRVLDVGCGTGILSMFAARGGAQNIIGIVLL